MKQIGAGVGVILLKNNQVLLGKRHVDPEKADTRFGGAGAWCLPGGALDFGESFENGAARETFEETGILISNPKVICLHNTVAEHAHFVTVGLMTEEFEGEAQVTEPDQITEWKWFDLDNIPKFLYGPSEIVIRKYLDKRFY